MKSRMLEDLYGSKSCFRPIFLVKKGTKSMAENSSIYDLVQARLENLAPLRVFRSSEQIELVKIDYVALLESLLPLDAEQQKRLIHFVCSRGLDINLFIQMLRRTGWMLSCTLQQSIKVRITGFYRWRCSRASSPACNRPQAQQVLTDPAAMTAAFKQLKIVESLHEF